MEASSLSDQQKSFGSRVLYRSTGDSALHVLTVISFVFALGSAVLATLILDSTVQLTRHITWNERVVWASGLLVAFCGFFVAVWMYERRVVDRITLSDDGKRVQVLTPSLFGSTEHLIATEDLLYARYHDGDGAGEEASSPPWLWVRVRDHASFVVPLNGVIPDRQKLLQVLCATR